MVGTDAMAVIACADELEVPLNVVREAIAGFHGVQRRFTVLGTPKLGNEVAIHAFAIEWKRERNLSLASPRTDHFHRAQDLFADFLRR